VYTNNFFVEYCRIIVEASENKNRRDGIMRNEEKDKIENEIIERLKKGQKWYYKLIIDIFKDLFYYVYRKGINECFKYYNK